MGGSTIKRGWGWPLSTPYASRSAMRQRINELPDQDEESYRKRKQKTVTWNIAGAYTGGRNALTASNIGWAPGDEPSPLDRIQGTEFRTDLSRKEVAG